MEKTLALIILVAWAVAAILLNVWFVRLRKNMTREERKKFDKELSNDMRIW